MTNPLRIVAAQLNLTVGDIVGNLKKHVAAATEARDKLQADLIVFSELSLTGYPPEDLLLRPAFIAEAEQALQTFTQQVQDIYCVVGHPHATSRGLYNACSIVYNGEIVGRYAKQHVPNYGVFDEARYFIPGNTHSVTTIKGVPVGVVICEDLWLPTPIQQAALQGARIIVSPNASPFEVGKHKQRLDTLSKRAKANNVSIVYVNQIGGQDDLIFDGDSMVIDASGDLTQQAALFEEELMVTDKALDPAPEAARGDSLDDTAVIYRALTFALKNYVDKNRFPGVLIGVSGGIDSALTLALAVDALGKDRVRAVIMPSQFTSNLSMEEAMTVANNMQVQHDIISIEPSNNAFLTTLAPFLNLGNNDVTEQNIQARCRGVILMALSNKTGHLVLPTGNRSETAVGYCTLYGDMAGGFAVLKDIPKTLVYELARYRNTVSEVIPPRTIERAPTAELAPDQKDEDSLPPYSILDPILELYLNQQLSIDEICAKGFEKETVTRVVNLVRINEYKRRQAAVGPRINHTAFGRDRRYPIVNGWRG